MTARRQMRMAVVATVAVLAVLAAALAAVAAERASHGHALDRARENAVAAATSGAATVLSYDYRHLGADFKKAQAVATTKFRKQYDKTTAAVVKPLAPKYKVITSAQITAAGTVSVDVDRVVVLVFASQTVTNTQLSAPRLDRSRINVTMVRDGDRWLIDQMSPI